jgi:phosphonate transport system substrate-binding protein
MDMKWIRMGLGLLVATVSTASQALVFAINEGVTYRASSTEIQTRYEGIAADLGKILNQPVTIEPVLAYPKLREGLAAKEYDLALVHPAHLSITAIKKSGYKLVAVVKGFQKYTASFLVMADSSMQSLQDLRGKKLGAPDEDSITSWIMRATVRDALGAGHDVKFFYTRFQDAVPFMVENTFTQAGVTASASVVKAWQAKGRRVLEKSKPVPIKHIIASPKLTPEQVQKVREYLVTLDTSEEGKKKLALTKYDGFAVFDEAELMAIGTWLGL